MSMRMGSGGYNPVNTLFQSMNTMRDFNRGQLRDKQEAELFDRRMNAYDRAESQERKAEQVATTRRGAAQQIANLEAGNFGAEDVAKLAPESSFKLGDASDAFDEKKQEEAMRQLWPYLNPVAGAQPDVPNEIKPPLLEASGALVVQGILSPTVAGLREQAQVTPLLKNKIRTLGDQLGPQLLGKKTRVTREMDPELFDQLTRAFPAVVNGSKAFKDGRGEIVELLIDASKVDKIQDATVVAVMEGINPQTGEKYRAPMTVRRSGDPDDELSQARIGGLYVQTGFTENASRAVLAALAGEDDATADRILKESWERAQEYKKEMDARRKNAGVAGALGGIVGLNADEQQKLSELAEAGGDPKTAIELLVKMREGDKVEVEWKENVLINGQPFAVAYDKNTGRPLGEAYKYPLYKNELHGKEASGSSAKGGSGGVGRELKSHEYNEFNRALMKAMVFKYGIPVPKEAIVIDMSGNERVDENRYLDQLPQEARQAYITAQSLGEGLMVDGGLSPIRAAQQALLSPTKDRGPEMMSTHGGQPGAYLPERAEAIAAAQQAIAEGRDKKAITARLEQLYPGASAEIGKQQPTNQGAGAAGMTPERVVVPKPGSKPEPTARPGMAMSDRGSLREIQGNINRSGLGDNPINRAGAKHLEMTTRAGKEVINAALVVPRLVARGAESAWVDFVNFSKSRYPSLDELVAFAKENPEAAQKVYEAAAANK